MSGIGLNIAGLTRSFGARTVLRGIDLTIAPGRFVALVGRSGCGKSSLLRLLAGLDRPDGGTIGVDDPAFDARRDLRIMFQDARLLPWLSVAQNVAVGLGGAGAADPGRVDAALAAMGLAQRAAAWPAALSGGQRQRVALARALVAAPRLLLLDEPMSALDALTRIEMQALIARLWGEQGFTAVLVTHDVAEAVTLADQVLVLDEGRIGMTVDIDLPRPRAPGDAAAAALERHILERLLVSPGAPP